MKIGIKFLDFHLGLTSRVFQAQIQVIKLIKYLKLPTWRYFGGKPYQTKN